MIKDMYGAITAFTLNSKHLLLFNLRLILIYLLFNIVNHLTNKYI